MEANLLRGADLAGRLKEELKADLERSRKKKARVPKLVAFQIGEDPSSEVYVKAQRNAAEEIGVEFALKSVPATTTQAAAEQELARLNKDRLVTGIIVQMPVPPHIDAGGLVEVLSPKKDAEGIHPENLGRLVLEKPTVVPCTANACMVMIESTGVGLRGKDVVIVGHSAIVGKPLCMLLVSKLATTTICHIGTSESGMLAAHVGRADILVAAAGKAGLIKGEWIKEGAIVIDVGINKTPAGIVGDVDFEGAKARASHITPVPGGIGPLTTVMLMRNVVRIFNR